MRVWKAVNEVKPSKSGIYRVKIDGLFFTFKRAYYDLPQERWVYDDGCWLPMDATAYITHWAEFNKH